MKPIFELLLNNPFGIMFIITGLSFLGIFLAVSWGRKDFKKALNKIDKWTLAILIIFFLLYLLFLIPGLKNGFVPSDEEWFGIKQAKDIISGDLQAFNQSQKGIGYPFVIAGFMAVFGVNEYAAVIANVLFSALTIVLIGLAAYVLSKKNIAAASSAIGYASLPLVVKFSGFSMGYPAMGAFFMALFAFFGSVAIKEKSLASHVAMWLVTALASGIKPEFIALAFPTIIAGIMTIKPAPKIKEKIKDNYPKLILLIIAIVISFIPFSVKYYQADRNLKAVGGVTGTYLSQKGDRPVSAIDKMLRPFLSSRMSFDYFVGDIDNFLSFVAELQKGTFIAIIIIGMTLSIKNKRKRNENARIFLFLITAACSVSATYMATDVVFNKEGGRFGFYMLPFITIMFGVGLTAIFEYLRGKAPFYLAIIPLLILPAYATDASFPNVLNYYDDKNRDFVLSMNEIKAIVASNNLDKAKTVIYTKHSNFTNFFRFNGYDSHAFTDDNAVNTATPSDSEEAAKNLKMTNWNNDKGKIMVIVPADEIENNDEISPIIREFIKYHEGEKIPFDLSRAKVYKLK